ncbi:hypothetical protein M2412_001017 [Stenotrophomonas rhizophila]|uniref:Uncharacterized protein n=1 Tax=Stenotrophomonas rhizophila TaxID=216778 RepID=A0AAW5PFJ7_9GAMM|nr:hypothetical protein [Stenotrophomonas rhizophila]
MAYLRPVSMEVPKINCWAMGRPFGGSFLPSERPPAMRGQDGVGQ